MTKKYTPKHIIDDNYIIGDHEYGYDLCRVNFYSDLTDILSSDEVENLIQEIASLVDNAILASQTKTDA